MEGEYKAEEQGKTDGNQWRSLFLIIERWIWKDEIFVVGLLLRTEGDDYDAGDEGHDAHVVLKV